MGNHRDKIKEKLRHHTSQVTTFKDMGGKLLRTKARVPKAPKYGLFRGTDTFSWNLNTTGASQQDSEELIFTDDGRIEQIILNFPAGSEYEYNIKMYIDRAQVFPSKLSQDLRGDNQIKKIGRAHV